MLKHLLKGEEMHQPCPTPPACSSLWLPTCRQVGQPEEVASVVSFLAMPAASCESVLWQATAPAQWHCRGGGLLRLSSFLFLARPSPPLRLSSFSVSVSWSLSWSLS